MKKVLVALTVSVTLALLGTFAAVAKDAPAGPQKVTNYGEKPVATFNHDTHKDQGCATCHHNEGDGKYKCGECHKLEDGDAPKIKDAFHGKDKGTCYACHLLKDAEKKMKCKECHAE
ncbi:MAG: cytochrome c3 family protein [Deferrisomatales bacterium]|nr:cytochrome c3 family protein [Deferrisomatales bacterium]